MKQMRKTITTTRAALEQRTDQPRKRKQAKAVDGNAPRLRHRCRNLQCRQKLPRPVENEQHAFCCRGCWESFHYARCVVCDGSRKPSQREGAAPVCEQDRAEYHRHPELYANPFGKVRKPVKSAFRGPQTTGEHPTYRPEKLSDGNARQTACFWPDISGRGWAWRAGVESHELLDRDDVVSAKLIADDRSWLLVKPVLYPEPPAEPDLARAKAMAVVAALSDLPPHESLADSLRRNNGVTLAKRNPDAVFQRETPITCEADHRAPADVAAIERFDGYAWKRGVTSDGVPYLVLDRTAPSSGAGNMSAQHTADVVSLATKSKHQSLPEWSGRDDADNLDIPEFLRRTETPPPITQAA
jgi:hypothetical protein